MAEKNVAYSKLLMLTVGIAAGIVAFICYETGALREIENLTLDGRFWVNSVTPKPSFNYNLIATGEGITFVPRVEKPADAARAPDIIFIDMPPAGNDTGESLARGDCATAIKILALWGARAIVLTDLLSQPSVKDQDVSLAEAMGGSRRVYLPMLFLADKETPEHPYDGAWIKEVREPMPFFEQQCVGVGHINAWPDLDGKIRRVLPVIRYKGKNVYQLGMKVGLEILGIGEKAVELDPAAHTILLRLPLTDERYIPLDEDNQLIVNWARPEKEPLPHIPFKDITESYRMALYGFRPIVDPQMFKGAVCILGTAESNAVTGMPGPSAGGQASAAACGMVLHGMLHESYVAQLDKGLNIALIFLVSILFGGSLMNMRVLRVMMIGVINITFFSIASVYGMLNLTSALVILGVSVPLGIVLTRFQLFSAFLFAVTSVFCYLIFSATFFKAFNLAIVTFYPVFAIVLIFVFFYVYAQLKAYLSNVRLFNMATRDGLTGLYNRRHLNLLLDSELSSLALHKGRKLSVVMCDIDNFKKLNDTHGHQAGDLILKEFAKIMRANTRQSDIVARYGGEEFMIILHSAAAKDALKVAENVRRAVEDKKFTFKGQPYSTSLSMGLVESKNEKTKEELIERADQALYRAKKEGKNRVCVGE